MKNYGVFDAKNSQSWSMFAGRTAKQKIISTAIGWVFNFWWILQYYHNCAPLFVKLMVRDFKISLV